MMLFLAVIAILVQEPRYEDGPDRFLKETLYRAEVFGEVDEARRSLRDLLRVHTQAAEASRADRAIVRTLALVNGPEQQGKLMPPSVGQPVQALFREGADAAVLIAGRWWFLGDWMGQAFLRQVQPGHLLLETLQGQTEEVTFPFRHLYETEGRGAAQLSVYSADMVEVLRLLNVLDGMNLFAPASLGTVRDRRFHFNNGLDLVSLLTQHVPVAWTLNGNNLILKPKTEARPGPVWVIDHFDRENITLGEFLDMVADRLGFELAVEPKLADLRMDVYLQDETWEQAMDCVAASHGLIWSLDDGSPHSQRPILIVTPNNATP